MFLKSLTISSFGKEIRQIKFHKGINLVVDETPEADTTATGNNVGKTTVLKLIDFCLGADSKTLYVDQESRKDVHTLVKDFLIDNSIVITLVLKVNLDINDSSEIKIERNFLPNKRKIQRINDQDLTEDEFELRLLELIIPEQEAEKPSFRQIISHNVRYKDESINNTIKTLDKFTTDAEYEALYLFLFGCKFMGGSTKQAIIEKIRQEDTYKKRLEKENTLTAYEAALSLVNSDIAALNLKKSNLNLNEDFEADLDKLNQIRYEINKTSSSLSKLVIRKNIIIEAEDELNSKKSDIDLQQLKLIYQQATAKISEVQKSFDDLVNYHNQMIVEKVKFIKKELPALENRIREEQEQLKDLLKNENSLALDVSKGDSFADLEILIKELNEKFRKKGEYEIVIRQLKEIEKNIEEHTDQLSKIDDELFSEEFKQRLEKQLNKFNVHFASISRQLYGEEYAVKYDIVSNKRGQKLYKFSSFNTNFSSGKKQGEISCFDLAYTMFADQEKISCLHFLLNDKKELMHDNQLVRIAEFVNKNNIQFVASILKDKLPDALNKEEYFTVKLSQSDKLFRIEKNSIS